jgi:hypothetical protein
LACSRVVLTAGENGTLAPGERSDQIVALIKTSAGKLQHRHRAPRKMFRLRAARYVCRYQPCSRRTQKRSLASLRHDLHTKPAFILPYHYSYATASGTRTVPCSSSARISPRKVRSPSVESRIYPSGALLGAQKPVPGVCCPPVGLRALTKAARTALLRAESVDGSSHT